MNDLIKTEFYPDVQIGTKQMVSILRPSTPGREVGATKRKGDFFKEDRDRCEGLERKACEKYEARVEIINDLNCERLQHKLRSCEAYVDVVTDPENAELRARLSGYVKH